MLDLGSRKAARPFDHEDNIMLHSVVSNLKYLSEVTTDENLRTHFNFALKAIELIAGDMK